MKKLSREEIIEQYRKWGWIKSDCEQFYNLPHEKKADKVIFEEFCKKHFGGLAIALSDDEICDNKELVFIAKKYGFWENYHLLSQRLLNDPEVALTFADGNIHQFTNFSKEIRSNVPLMRKAVKIKPSIYLDLPVECKADKEIVLIVAREDPIRLKALLHVRKELREVLLHDKEIALLFAKKCPESLNEIFDESIISDKNVLEEAFSVSNPEICKKRLLKSTWAIKYVDPKIWLNDRNFIEVALHEDGCFYSILPEEYKNDKKLAQIAVKECPYVLGDMPLQFRDDKELVWAALQIDTECVLSFASERLKADFETVYKAVRVDPLNLEFASDDLKDNEEIVLKAVSGFGGVLEDASPRLQRDKRLIEIAKKNA